MCLFCSVIDCLGGWMLILSAKKYFLLRDLKGLDFRVLRLCLGLLEDVLFLLDIK